MTRSIYILCDDCHKEYCVSVINKNKGFRQTSYLAEAEFVFQHGELSAFQKNQLELARQSGKIILSQADISKKLPQHGLCPKEWNFDIEL